MHRKFPFSFRVLYFHRLIRIGFLADGIYSTHQHISMLQHGATLNNKHLNTTRISARLLAQLYTIEHKRTLQRVLQRRRTQFHLPLAVSILRALPTTSSLGCCVAFLDSVPSCGWLSGLRYSCCRLTGRLVLPS